LVEALRPDRTVSSSPLFQVVFGLHHQRELALPQLDLVLSPVEIDWHATQFDLIVRAMETEQGLKVLMTYSTDLFEDATITRLLKHYKAWLEAITLNPESRLLDIPLQLESEPEPWSELAGNLPLTFASHQFSFGQDQ
jgi:non-ribosomal peptide synthetase component F